MLFRLFNLSETGCLGVEEAVLALRTVAVGLTKAAGGTFPLQADVEATAVGVRVLPSGWVGGG